MAASAHFIYCREIIAGLWSFSSSEEDHPVVGVQPCREWEQRAGGEDGRIFEDLIQDRSVEHQRGSHRHKCSSVITFL